MSTPMRIAWTPAYPVRTPPQAWGDSHWRVLQYVEERCVSNGGTLSPEHLRINPEQHYQQYAQGAAARAKTEEFTPSVIKAADYPATDGNYAEKALIGHDEYDCLDDLGAAGYLRCTWPRMNRDGTYSGAFGVVTTGKQAITSRSLPPLDVANHLMLHARWQLTEIGWAAVFALRRYLADGGRHHNFIAPD